MSPTLAASIREALGKPYLSEEACRRVAVAVLLGVRDVAPTPFVALGAPARELMAWECFMGDGSEWSPDDVFTAMIDALLSEIRG